MQPLQRLRRCAGKLTGLDKELSKSIDLDLQNGAPEAELSSSPVGPLAEANRCEDAASVTAVCRMLRSLASCCSAVCRVLLSL